MNAKADVVTQLDSIHLFNGLPAPTLRRLAASCQVLQPPAGTRLFALGDPPDAVYARGSCEGRVRVGAPDARGKRLLIEVLQAGDILAKSACSPTSRAAPMPTSRDASSSCGSRVANSWRRSKANRGSRASLRRASAGRW
jgi:hypothetical protein